MVRLCVGVVFACMACGLAGCRAERFVSPDKPDLYKVPYDFAPADDLGTAPDLSAAVDLARPDDLAERD